MESCGKAPPSSKAVALLEDKSLEEAIKTVYMDLETQHIPDTSESDELLAKINMVSSTLEYFQELLERAALSIQMQISVQNSGKLTHAQISFLEKVNARVSFKLKTIDLAYQHVEEHRKRLFSHLCLEKQEAREVQECSHSCVEGKLPSPTTRIAILPSHLDDLLFHRPNTHFYVDTYTLDETTKELTIQIILCKPTLAAEYRAFQQTIRELFLKEGYPHVRFEMSEPSS